MWSCLTVIAHLCSINIKSSNTDTYSYGSGVMQPCNDSILKKGEGGGQVNLPKKVTANPSKTQAHFPRKK